MPLHRLLLILLCVLIAGLATIWLGALLSASLKVPLAGFLLLPITLLAFLAYRALADRASGRDEGP